MGLRQLIAAGEELNDKTEDNESPLSIARDLGDKELEAFLKNAGAKE